MRCIQPSKKQVALDWPRPTTGKQIMAYLGFCNYLRDYIALYASLAKPLDELRYKKKLSEADWTPERVAAFKGLKQALVSAPTLHHPLPNLPYIVTVDASLYGLGAVLSQEVDGKTCFIMFASRALNGAQRRYSATKRELLACVFALQRLRYWLFGQKFVLRCDHKSLCYMLTQERPSMAVQSWLDVLLSYDFTIEYLPGVMNTLADSLSRVYPPFLHEAAAQEERARNAITGHSNRECEAAAKTTDTHPNQTETVKLVAAIAPQEQRGAAKPLRLEELLLDESSPNTYVELRRFVRERFSKELPPSQDRRAILEQAHAIGHFGAEAIVQRVLRTGKFWPTIRRDAQELVQHCASCLRHNIRRSGFRPLRPIHASLPFEHVQVDLAEFPPSQDGRVFMLVLTDVATRFTVLRPLSNKAAATVARELWSIFCLLMFPTILQSDQGTEFVNSVLTEFTRLAGIDKRLVLAYSPRGDGLVESRVKMAKSVIKKLVKGLWTQWPLFVDQAQLAINTKVTPTTKSAPAELMYGRPLRSLTNYADIESKPLTEARLKDRWRVMQELVWPETANSMKAHQERMAATTDKGRVVRESPFPVHSRVMLRDVRRKSKYDQRYTGPYTISEVSARGAYKLTNAAGFTLSKWQSHNHLKLIELPDPSAAQDLATEPPASAQAADDAPEAGAEDDIPATIPVDGSHVQPPRPERSGTSVPRALQDARPHTAAVDVEVNQQTSKGRRQRRQRHKPRRLQDGANLQLLDNALRVEQQERGPRRKPALHQRSPLAEPDIFNVEKILDHKEEDGMMYFKVRWEGYGAEDDTWESKDNFHSEAVVRAYLEEVGART